MTGANPASQPQASHHEHLQAIQAGAEAQLRRDEALRLAGLPTGASVPTSLPAGKTISEISRQLTNAQMEVEAAARAAAEADETVTARTRDLAAAADPGAPKTWPTPVGSRPPTAWPTRSRRGARCYEFVDRVKEALRQPVVWDDGVLIAKEDITVVSKNAVNEDV